MGEQNDHDDLIELDAAAARVHTLRETWLPRLGTESVGLDAVAGRVLAAPLDAPTDIPAESRATMDGFAVDATDDYPLDVADAEVFPEDTAPVLEPGTAVRIATGAPVPEGATAVLRREDATVEDGRLTGASIDPGTYVYERGSNVAAGERLFAAGERLSPKDALLLGELGVDEVTVREPYSVGLLATGTEIHEGTYRDLDSPMLAGLVRSWGHTATYEGTVPDDEGRVEARIDELAREHDVVVTTGGTSVGDKDHVVAALAELGEVLFHRVRLRPGKPIAVARLDDHDAVAVAVPGKPVGAHAVTTLVARPLFTGETGLATVEARLARAVGIGTPGFSYAIPVTLADGEAMPLGHVDSPLPVYEHTFDPSVLSSATRATRADGFVLTETGLDRDESVEVVPYPVVER